MIDKIHDIVLNASQLSMRSIFSIGICVWESSVKDGCRDCSESTKNAFMWPLRTKIGPILTVIRKSFFVNLRRRMKNGSTTILRNHMKGQNSGLNLVKLHQSVRKRKNRLGKLWLVFFWDAHGVIFIDYLEKERTISGAYYAALLDRLVDEIRKKRPHLKVKKIPFHDDTAPSHTSNITQAKKHELGFASLPHPPYSPDLAPSETEGHFGGYDKS